MLKQVILTATEGRGAQGSASKSGIERETSSSRTRFAKPQGGESAWEFKESFIVTLLLS